MLFFRLWGMNRQKITKPGKKQYAVREEWNGNSKTRGGDVLRHSLCGFPSLLRAGQTEDLPVAASIHSSVVPIRTVAPHIFGT
jgi:hypothetical protein